MKLQIILWAILFFSLNFLVYGQQTSSVIEMDNSGNSISSPQNINFCELMKNPETYVGKYIRIEATYSYLITMEFVLSAECDPKVKAVSVGFADGKFDKLSNEISSAKKSLKKNDITTTVIGKFLGPRKPDSKYNYGHYGWSKYQFEIHTFEKIEGISEK